MTNAIPFALTTTRLWEHFPVLTGPWVDRNLHGLHGKFRLLSFQVYVDFCMAEFDNNEQFLGQICARWKFKGTGIDWTCKN